METIWFVLIGILFGGYVVLDGFDLGVGNLYLLVAKSEAERAQVRSAIGPVWDGNEVWLIAAGGTLFFAFPKAYATAFSAFYLAFFLILWLLIFRGLAIELRGQLDNPLWHTFWDVIFSFASLALAGLLGVALGNLLRGIPLPTTGRYALPFWTNFLPGTNAGLLDWYTLLVGGLAVVTFTLQGANFLTLKTEGELQRRVRGLATRSGLILIPLVLLVFAVTPWVQPALREHFLTQPLGLVFPFLALGVLAGLTFLSRKQANARSFIASSLLILAMFATVLYALYPNLLLDTTEPLNSLTIYNAATSAYGLRVGLIWFGIGFTLLLTYVGFMYRSFWGKVPNAEEY
jgi:cytochrome bd ubiquinol oxidase subunit II